MRLESQVMSNQTGIKWIQEGGKGILRVQKKQAENKVREFTCDSNKI